MESQIQLGNIHHDPEMQQQIKSNVQEAQKPNQLYYRVREGDSIIRLSFMFNIKINHLQSINDLSSDYIFPGQVLKIINHNPENQHLLMTQEQLDSDLTKDLDSFGSGGDSQIIHSVSENNLSDSRSTDMKSQSIYQAKKTAGNFLHVDTKNKQQRKGSGQMSPNRTKVLTQDDITSEFQKLQSTILVFITLIVGYKNMQESFQNASKKEENDLLRLFGRLTQAAGADKKISEIDKIQLQYFIDHQPDKIKSEGYYCTKNGKVKGVFTLTEHLVMFDPIKCAENDEFNSDLQKYQAIIDIQDIASCQKIRTENQTAQFIQDPEVKKYYKYDYFIQMNLLTVDGLNLVKVMKTLSGLHDDDSGKKFDHLPLIEEKKENDNSMKHKAYHKKGVVPIATTFFRFSHRDKSNNPLSNKAQKIIVEDIYQALLRYIEKNSLIPRNEDGSSSTSIQFYDSLDHVERQSQVDSLKHVQHYDKSTFVISASLPEFQTIMKNKSEIIDEASRKLIAYFLPGLIRMREWRLLFSINQDGVSMQTFYNLVRNRDNTLLLIKDLNDRVFGGFCCEEWRIRNSFYGIGESFVFYFDDEEDIRVFNYTGANERIQFSDEKCIMIGGGNSAAIFINNHFHSGRSGKSETFDNEILSKYGDFTCKQFEVWGFDII
ncbi:oxidation resistance protein [Stylonychia lemnae]|uniref:Oxidation resistance protein n=1 Tax=Stylonychia lemnae TaxID=5949 RepID=A0A078AR61_STYLE|nr:oxidation resistance protein [Stylonychia lemnae]|eukprot:CDW83732.1 oxidation resistance protein [Stylonychia lemnae]